MRSYQTSVRGCNLHDWRIQVFLAWRPQNHSINLPDLVEGLAWGTSRGRGKEFTAISTMARVDVSETSQPKCAPDDSSAQRTLNPREMKFDYHSETFGCYCGIW
jgi:hypothetical protein